MNQRSQIRSKMNAILSTDGDFFNSLSAVFGQFYYTNNPAGT
jgi:hypothetical protein